MKKICFITTIAPTLEGFVFEFAKYMHSMTGYDITFICDYDSEFEKKIPDYVHYIPIEMKRGISINGLKACIKMISIFKKNKFDIVQYSTPNASLYASIAGKIAKIPVRLYCQWGLAYMGFKGLKKSVFYAAEKLVCKLSTWIEPDSKGNLDFCHAQKLYPADKGSVINNGSACGVSLEKFDIKLKKEYRNEIRNKYNISQDAFVYGFVGRITGDKGINELLSATQNLLKTYNDIYVLFVGEFDKKYSISRELLEWSKSDKHIIYCGATSNAEKYYAAMDCYVMPSYREGFGLTVVEAGAMGLPVICTNIPGPTDAIVDGVTGIVIEKQNVCELENAIKKLYSDRELAAKLGSAGLKNVMENYEQKTLFRYILDDRLKLMES